MSSLACFTPSCYRSCGSSSYTSSVCDFPEIFKEAKCYDNELNAIKQELQNLSQKPTHSSIELYIIYEQIKDLIAHLSSTEEEAFFTTTQQSTSHIIKALTSINKNLEASVQASKYSEAVIIDPQAVQFFLDLLDDDLVAHSILGEGSFGLVSLKSLNNRLYAAKTYKLPQSNSVAQENSILAVLSQYPHRHVISTIAFLVLDQQKASGVIMQYCNAGSLDTHIGKLSIEGCTLVARHIIEGLKHLHGLGLAHRDLKPANILLNRDLQGNIEAVVADLGFASESHKESKVGTYIYQPPEALLYALQQRSLIFQEQDQMLPPNGKPIDMWSFGAILFELISNKRIPKRDVVEIDEILSQVSDPNFLASRMKLCMHGPFQSLASRHFIILRDTMASSLQIPAILRPTVTEALYTLEQD